MPPPEDQLLRRLQVHQRDGVVTADLGDIAWVTPALVVGLAALAHQSAERGQPFRLRGPHTDEPAHYVARMRLGVMLSELGARHDLPPVRERDQSEHLVEVNAIRSPADSRRLAGLVYAKLAPVDLAVARALHQSVAEIGDNVSDHSGTIGFMAAQTMHRRRELLVAVADAGVGLRQTLAARGAATDRDAILLAMRADVSRYDEPDRGTGLPTTLNLIGGLAGSVYIASGDCSIRQFPRARRYRAAPASMPGTIVEARIPLHGRGH